MKKCESAPKISTSKTIRMNNQWRNILHGIKYRICKKTSENRPVSILNKYLMDLIRKNSKNDFHLMYIYACDQMETVRRLLFNNAVANQQETLEIKTDNRDLREFLCLRKTKLTCIIMLAIVEIFDRIYAIESYPTEMTKAIFSCIATTDIIVLIILIRCRTEWHEKNTFLVGFYAFIMNSLKLFALFVPYVYVIFNQSFEENSMFILTVVAPWYFPYMTILMTFKRNTYNLSKIINTVDAWKILEIIYAPVNIFVYSIAVNIVATLVIYYNLDSGIVSAIYVLWILGVSEIIALYHKYNKIANVLYLLWVITLVTTLSIVDKLLGTELASGIVRFAISTTINGIKLNWLCKDVLCYIYDIKFDNSRDVEMLLSNE